MYKDRIMKWRLDKNNKQGDLLAMLCKNIEREAVGKQGSFRVRLQPVTMEQVLHYFNRKNNMRDQKAYRVPKPSDVSCRTPSPVPAVPSLRMTPKWPQQTVSYGRNNLLRPRKLIALTQHRLLMAPKLITGCGLVQGPFLR